MKRLITRFVPSPAMVVALIALALSLGASGYAASRTLFAKNADTVDKIHASKTPKPNKLLPLNKAGKLPASVLTLDQGPKGDTGAQGQQGLQGPQGEKGPKGDKGDQGANGATNVVIRFATKTANAGVVDTLDASCDAGERPTGGGFVLVNGSIASFLVFQSGPEPELTQGATPTGWRVRWYNSGTTSDQVEAYVICAAP